MLKASRGHIPALGDPAEEEERGMTTLSHTTVMITVFMCIYKSA